MENGSCSTDSGASKSFQAVACKQLPLQTADNKNEQTLQAPKPLQQLSALPAAAFGEGSWCLGESATDSSLLCGRQKITGTGWTPAGHEISEDEVWKTFDSEVRRLAGEYVAPPLPAALAKEEEAMLGSKARHYSE